MKQIIKEQIFLKEIFCDFCKRKAFRIKKCRICQKDICSMCAVMVDDNYLLTGEFFSDYPDYYCHHCWDIGENIRKKITKFRESERTKENVFWDEWRKLVT